VAETGVLADDHRRCVQAGHQRLVRELGRRELGELPGERQCTEHVDAELLDQLGPPHEGRQHGRMRAGTHHLGRVRHESQQHAGDALGRRRVNGLADDRGVTAVDPVEHPDGDDTSPPVGGDGVEPMPALHDR